MRRLIALTLAAVLALTVAGSVMAKGNPKGGGNAGATTGIVVPDGVFAGTTTATITNGSGWAHAKCLQSGVVVYEQFLTVTAGQATFTLGPTPRWTGGAATCTADAGNWSSSGKWSVSASTTFGVS